MYYWTKAAAEAIMTRKEQYTKWSYENGIAMRALWMAADATGDDAFYDHAIAYTNKYVMPDGSIPTYPRDTCNIDMICFGALLPKLYEKTGDERYKTAALMLLKQFDIQPRTREGGFWHKKVYPYQMWLDGLYMGCPFLTRMAAFTGKKELYDEVAHQLTLCFEHTYAPEKGLCYHAWDSEKAQPWADPVTGRSPNVWGRAMGWFSVAHADVLAEFPQDHPAFPRLVAQFRVLAAGIKKWQTEGLWYQVMDMPGREGNYTESSCSAMFAFALAKGVKAGLLDEEYLEVAQKAICTLIAKKVTIGEDRLPHLNDVCRVAGLGGAPYGDAKYRDGSYNYYIHE